MYAFTTLLRAGTGSIFTHRPWITRGMLKLHSCAHQDSKIPRGEKSQWMSTSISVTKSGREPGPTGQPACDSATVMFCGAKQNHTKRLILILTPFHCCWFCTLTLGLEIRGPSNRQHAESQLPNKCNIIKGIKRKKKVRNIFQTEKCCLKMQPSGWQNGLCPDPVRVYLSALWQRHCSEGVMEHKVAATMAGV
jgi:hypothetical protein